MLTSFIEYDRPLGSNKTITLVYNITLNSGDSISVSSTSSEVSFSAVGYTIDEQISTSSATPTPTHTPTPTPT